MTLTGADFWHLIEHIIPVYVIVMGGYILVRQKVIKPVHVPGINRWVSVIGIPAYAFYLLAYNDPYKVSLRLVGADVLQKAVALLLGCLYWRFAKTGKIDNLIDFFMLATLPNTVLVGDALLDPLYGEDIHGKVVTIIFLQAILWYNLCITLYELRFVLLQMKEKEAAAEITGKEQSGISSRKSNLSIVVVGNEPHEKIGYQTPSPNFSSSRVLERTLSAPARVSFQKIVLIINKPFDDGLTVKGFPTPGDDYSGVLDRFSMVSEELNGGKPTRKSGGYDQDIIQEGFESDGMVEVVNPPEPEFKSKAKRDNRIVFVSKVAFKVVNRLKYAPLTYGSILGFIYSLFAFKYDWTLPYYLSTSLELISNTAVGIALFIVGMTWAYSGRIISCGWKMMSYGMVFRFLVGPIIMIFTSLAFGLRGTNFRFAVLQAVIPQGIISFVLSKEYNVNPEQFSTAVIFQLIVFVPIVIIYYYILDAV